MADVGSGGETRRDDWGGTNPPPPPPPPPAPMPPVDPLELGAGVLAFTAWIGLMVCGITVRSQDYIVPLRDWMSKGPLEAIGCLIVVALCHTVTNTAILCCVSAFLGVLGFRAVGRAAGTTVPFSRRDAYLAAVTRGFFIFLAIQSGTVVVSDQPLTNLSLDKYIRLAGLSSLFSFAVGYNPEVFRQLMARVNGNLAGPNPPK